MSLALRNVSLSLGALLLAASLSSCSTEKENVNPQPELRTQLPADPSGEADYLIDFGVVTVGGRAAKKVELRNVGARSLVLVAQAVSEPFSSERLDAPLEIGVGAAEEVVFAFEPLEAMAETVDTIVEIETNLPDAQRRRVRLAGRGASPLVTCRPSSLDFGSVVRGTSRTLTTTCTNDQEVPVELASLSFRGNSAEYFSAVVAGDGGTSSAIPAGGSVAIEVRFSSELVGLNDAALMLRDHNEQEMGYVPARATTVVSSLRIDPASCLQFSYVEVNGSAKKTLKLSNMGTHELRVLSMELGSGAVSGFALQPTLPIVLSRDAVAEVEVEFKPTVGGRQTAMIEIGTSEEKISACVSGFGGGPKLVCSPTTLDFGQTAIGTLVDLPYHCKNEGYQPPGEAIDRLVVQGVATDNPLFSATFLGPDGLPAQPDPKGYGIGEGFSVMVGFEPEAMGAASGNAILTTKVSTEPHQTPLAGLGVSLPPCDFRVTPSELQFGVVNRGAERTVDVGVENLGTSACLISGLRLSAGSSAAFRVEERATFELAAGARMVIPVRFAPASYGEYTGVLELQVSNPSRRQQTVPLRGRSAQTCLSVEPGPVDFGKVTPDCESRDQTVTITNVCGLPLVVSGLEVLDTASSSSFQLVQPLGRKELLPHDEVTAQVRFLPREEGSFEGALHVQVEGDPDGYVSNMVGEGSFDPMQTDVYSQQAQTKVDVLWVIDNAPTSSQFRGAGFAERLSLETFLAYAEGQGIDYQLGVTTTAARRTVGASNCPGGADCAEYGRLFPIDGRTPMNPPWPRILSRRTLSQYPLEEVWKYNLGVGGGARIGDQAPLEAARLALSSPLIDSVRDPRPVGSCTECKTGQEVWDDGNLGFLREDAHLSIIAFTDQVDHSEFGMSPAQYVDAYRHTKKPALRDSFKFHAITVPHSSNPKSSCGVYGQRGDRLLEVVTATKGEWLDICTSLSDVEAWHAGIERISRSIFGIPSRFVLRGTPADRNGSGTVTEADLEVLVDGISTPPRKNGVDVWKYDAVNNAVDFTPLYRPAPGETISVTYQNACNAN